MYLAEAPLKQSHLTMSRKDSLIFENVRKELLAHPILMFTENGCAMLAEANGDQIKLNKFQTGITVTAGFKISNELSDTEFQTVVISIIETFTTLSSESIIAYESISSNSNSEFPNLFQMSGLINYVEYEGQLIPVVGDFGVLLPACAEVNY